MGTPAVPLQGLSAHELLRVHDAAASAAPVRRGSAILAAVLPELGDPALLPIGTCDTVLLALRVGTFGPGLSGVADCPVCGEPVDVETDCGAMLSALPAPDPGADPVGRLSHSGWSVVFRLPATADLVAAGRAGDPRAELIARCLLEASASDGESPGTALPGEVLAAVADAMAAQDPAADLRLRLTCPECGHEWAARFDVAGFFWSEIDAAARGLLREVDLLASRYGWSEAAILGLSPTRRRAYVGLQ